MKVFIHTDLEGVCSFYDWDEVNMPTSRGIGYTKEFLTQEVNAAIEGVRLVCPDAEFVVEDGHGGGFLGPNIISEKLHRQAKLIVGKFNQHLSTIDSSFNFLMIVGAHSMAGTPCGQMNHTLSTEKFYNVILNNVPVGEIGICTAIAGSYGVPLGMVSGDYWATKEAEQLIENVWTASVKKGLNAFCAECLQPEVARTLIREAAKNAADQKNSLRPYEIRGDIEVQIDYMQTSQADEAVYKAGGKRIGNRSVMFTGNDIRQVFNRCFT